jgi:hypothetical protein
MFIWSAADAETRQAEALEIEPVHFLLGLTKLAELPEQACIDSDDEENDVLMEITVEAAAVREACSNCGLNPTCLRYKLRDALPTPVASATQELLLDFGVSATRVGCIDRKQFASEDWTFADIILTAQRT